MAGAASREEKRKRTATVVRWGILAPSNVSRRFVADLQTVADAAILAVGSRDAGRAKAYADEFGIPRAYGSYEELVADPEIDVVYVSSPHTSHYPHTMLALEHGKAALVEKPFAMNVRQATEMVELAQSRGLFLMEAMWSRTHPGSIEMVRRIREGQIGEVLTVNASLGPRGSFWERRAQQPELGGGVLLECGVYPLSFAYQVLADKGDPVDVAAWASMNARGIDQAITAVLDYGSGVTAAIASSFAMGVTGGSTGSGYVSGTTGWIEVPKEIFWINEFTVWRPGRDPERVVLESRGNGYTHEAEEVVRCIQEGATESRLVPLDGTLATMRVLDRIREQIGLRYDADLEPDGVH